MVGMKGMLNILDGNTIGCPLDPKVLEADEWGKEYVCGWNRLAGRVRPAPSAECRAVVGVGQGVRLRLEPARGAGGALALEKTAAAT